MVRVVVFIIGAVLAGSGGYLVWINRALASSLFPIDPAHAPWTLVGGMAAAAIGLVMLVSGLAPRTRSKAQKIEDQQRRERTIKDADAFYASRAQGKQHPADRDWRSGAIPPEPKPQPQPAPQPFAAPPPQEPLPPLFTAQRQPAAAQPPIIPPRPQEPLIPPRPAPQPAPQPVQAKPAPQPFQAPPAPQPKPQPQPFQAAPAPQRAPEPPPAPRPAPTQAPLQPQQQAPSMVIPQIFGETPQAAPPQAPPQPAPQPQPVRQAAPPPQPEPAPAPRPAPPQAPPVVIPQIFGETPPPAAAQAAPPQPMKPVTPPPAPPPPQPQPQPQPVRAAAPTPTPPPPQPAPVPPPTPELVASARPVAAKPQASAVPPTNMPGASPFFSGANLSPIPRASDPPQQPVQAKPQPAPAAPAPTPIAAAAPSSGNAAFDKIRALLGQNRLDEADKVLSEERDRLTKLGDTEKVALAELTALAGDHAAAAGRTSNAKWLWRLALKRFQEAQAMSVPAAKAVSERLRLADQ